MRACLVPGKSAIALTWATGSWKDADASDASFRLEKRLSILKMLLGHGGLSLYSLNAPQDAMEGVTPLGLAAWLNIPDAVALLLRECPGSVTVNGMDSRGATPLMCEYMRVTVVDAFAHLRVPR